MPSYRYRLGKHAGPWRDTRSEVMRDATEAGYAGRDKWGQPWKDALLEVEERR